MCIIDNNKKQSSFKSVISYNISLKKTQQNDVVLKALF